MHCRQAAWRIVVTLIVGWAGWTAGAVTLYEAGRPLAVIVTAERPTGVVRHAVAELNEHLTAMTGTALPVVVESALDGADVRPRVLVGDTAESRAAGLDTASLEPEAIVVRCSGTRLFLLGGDRDDRNRVPATADRAIGTLYAVYDFLENDLGVRWLWPGATGTVVPRRADVAIPDGDRRFQPPLIQRHIRPGLRDWDNAVGKLGMTPEMTDRLGKEYTAWSARRRLGRRANFRFGHAYNNWLRDYGKEHPEWFAMMPDGTRVTPEKPYPSLERAKLCDTNPELLDFIAARGVDYLEKNPDALSFSACPNDSRGYCMCPTCKALDPPEGLPTEMNYPGQNFQYPSLSDRMVWHWNQIALRLGDRCPGRYIGAYAYSNYNHPPLREKLSPRVVIAYVGFNYLNAEYNEQSRRDWAGWSATGCKLFLRPNLLLVGHGFPMNYARDLGRDIQECFRTGMLGTDFDSMTHQYAAQAPIFYVLTGLLWDPTRSVDALLDEFLTAAYGPAVAPMRQYWDRLEALTREIAAYRDPNADHDRDRGFHEMTAVYYNDEVLGELRGFLAAARTAAAGDDGVQARLAACQTALDYARIQRDLRQAVADHRGSPESTARVTALLQEKQGFFRQHLDDWTLGLHHVYWREARSTTHRRLYGGGFEEALPRPNELARLVTWRFQTDPEGRGDQDGWQTAGFDDGAWKEISSLNAWETQGWAGYDGLAWYRCRLEVPAAWANRKRLAIEFGAVDESFRLYVDGAMVHESLFAASEDPELWKKPRRVDLTGILKPGTTQTLAVRVHDSGGAGGLWKPVVLLYED